MVTLYGVGLTSIINIINKKQGLNFINKIKFVLVSLLYAYVGVILLKLILEFISSYLNFNIHIEKSNNKRDLVKFFISIILIAPIVEELIFRLHLIFKKKYFILSLLILVSILISEIIKDKFSNLNIFFYLSYISYLLVIYFIRKNKKFVDALYYEKFNILINCLFFALFHITNYKAINFDNIYIYIINVIPMFIFGFYFSKIRLKLNIYWAIFAHMISNSIPFIFFILRNNV